MTTRHTPTPDERARERAFAGAASADCALVVLFVVTAIASGSLTSLAVALQGLPILVIELWSLAVMRADHRGRLAHYDYGTGKLEQFVWLVVAGGRLLAVIFILDRVFETLFAGAAAASPLGLALAAVVNAMYFLVNAVAYVALTRAAKGDLGGAFGAQIVLRKGMLVAAAVLQVCLTGAALARDPGVAMAADAAGGLIVAALMTRGVLRMLARALPDLLDAPPHAATAAEVRRAAVDAFGPAALVSVRMRRSGRRTFAQVAVDGAAFADTAALAARAAIMQTELSEHGLDVGVVLAPAQDALVAAEEGALAG